MKKTVKTMTAGLVTLTMLAVPITAHAYIPHTRQSIVPEELIEQVFPEEIIVTQEETELAAPAQEETELTAPVPEETEPAVPVTPEETETIQEQTEPQEYTVPAEDPAPEAPAPTPEEVPSQQAEETQPEDKPQAVPDVEEETEAQTNLAESEQTEPEQTEQPGQESETASEPETGAAAETEAETETESETETETETEKKDEVLIRGGSTVSSSWSAPYDHSVAKTFYTMTLTRPATVEWVIRYPDGRVFNSYSQHFDAGTANLTWTAVDQNGWHPAGSQGNRTEVNFQVSVKATDAEGKSQEQSFAYDFYFAHSIEQHADYVAPEKPGNDAGSDAGTDGTVTSVSTSTQQAGNEQAPHTAVVTDVPKTGDRRVRLIVFPTLASVLTACMITLARWRKRRII